jgi:hypothetical protein
LFVHYEEGGFEDRVDFWTEVPSDWSDGDLQELIDWPTIGSHYPSWEVPARAFGQSELFRWWKGEIESHSRKRRSGPRSDFGSR